MEYDEVTALFDYWKVNPPAHILVQGFFKMGGSGSEAAPKNPDEMSDKQFQELTSMFPRGNVIGG